MRNRWQDPMRELKEFSFAQNVVVTGTKPVLLGIKNELFEIPRQSWRSLYLLFLATFYAHAEYRNAIKSVVSWSARSDFLRESQKIGHSVFVETNNCSRSTFMASFMPSRRSSITKLGPCSIRAFKICESKLYLFSEFSMFVLCFSLLQNQK